VAQQIISEQTRSIAYLLSAGIIGAPTGVLFEYAGDDATNDASTGIYAHACNGKREKQRRIDENNKPVCCDCSARLPDALQHQHLHIYSLATVLQIETNQQKHTTQNTTPIRV